MSIYLYMVCEKCRKSQRIGDSEGMAMRDFCFEHYEHLDEVRVKDDRRCDVPYDEEEEEP